MSKLCHCSIPKGGPERVTQTTLGKKLKRKEGRERGRGTGKGEERKEGEKGRKGGSGGREKETDWKASQQKLSHLASLAAVVA